MNKCISTVRQGAKWAVTIKFEDKNGAIHDQAVGPHCDACYWVALDVFYLEDMDEYHELLKNDEVRTLAEGINKRRLAMQMPAASRPEVVPGAAAVAETTGCRAVISKCAVGLTSAEVKSLVDTQRLAIEKTKILPVISKSGASVPPCDLEDDDKLWLFPDPDKPHYRVRLEKYIDIGKAQSRLTPELNMHPKHAEDCVAHCMDNSQRSCGWDTLCDGKWMKQLDSFVDDYKKWQADNAATRDRPGCARSDDQVGEVAGRAAANLVFTSGKVDDDSVPADMFADLSQLASPTKKKPRAAAAEGDLDEDGDQQSLAIDEEEDQLEEQCDAGDLCITCYFLYAIVYI